MFLNFPCSFSPMDLLLQLVPTMPHVDCSIFALTKKSECIHMITSSVVLRQLPFPKVADYYLEAMTTLTVTFGTHLSKREQVIIINFFFKCKIAFLKHGFEVFRNVSQLCIPTVNLLGSRYLLTSFVTYWILWLVIKVC